MYATAMAWIQRHPFWSSIGSGTAITFIGKQIGLDLVFGTISDWIKDTASKVVGEQFLSITVQIVSYVISIIIISLIAYLLFQAGRTSGKARGVVSNLEGELKRDVSLYDALWRIFYGHWGEAGFDFDGPGVGQEVANKFHDLVVDGIRNKAFEGEIPIWALNKNTGLWDLVPRDFWQTHHPNWFSFLRGKDKFTLTTRTTQAVESEWQKPMTNKAIVGSLWPVGILSEAGLLTPAQHVAVKKQNMTNVIGAPIILALLVFITYKVLQNTDRSGVQPVQIGEAYWAPLTIDQKEKLTKALLKVNRGKMLIGCNYGECRVLARDFYELFSSLGWEVDPPHGQGIDAFVEGIVLSPQTKETRQISDAISASTDFKISVEGGIIPNQETPITLNVGTKPVMP